MPRIDEVTHQLIDQFIDRGSCEFVSEFALPMPGIIICEQLGLPASEYQTFKKWADAMLAMGAEFDKQAIVNQLKSYYAKAA